MSRVWKKFFVKISKGVAAITYMLGSMMLGGTVSYWLGYPFEAGVFTSSMLLIILPMIALLLRYVYKDSKQEVEWENHKMMNTLKGSNHDY